MMARKHNILTVLLLSAAPAAASPAAHRTPPPDQAAGRQPPEARIHLLPQGGDPAAAIAAIAALRPLCDQDGYPLVGNVAFKGDTVQPRPAPPADAVAARPLLELRAQLLHAGRDKAQAEVARFRPLCDKDGYPLVGNVANKGDMYQPSELCSDVRKTEKRT